VVAEISPEAWCFLSKRSPLSVLLAVILSCFLRESCKERA